MNAKLFEEESVEILKIYGIIGSIRKHTIMAEEILEINQNKLMSKKHKKVWQVFNYIEHLF